MARSPRGGCTTPAGLIDIELTGQRRGKKISHCLGDRRRQAAQIAFPLRL